MRQNLPVLLAVIAILGLGLLVAYIDQRQKPIKAERELVIYTPKIVASDPEYFSGKEVAISTSGMEITKSGLELMYRDRADCPYHTICYMKEAIDKIPPYIKGKCLGKQPLITLVLIVECVPYTPKTN